MEHREGFTYPIEKGCVSMNNADKIRSMSDEELAMCLYEIGYYRGWNALEGTLEWLKQPAEEVDNGKAD